MGSTILVGQCVQVINHMINYEVRDFILVSPSAGKPCIHCAAETLLNNCNRITSIDDNINLYLFILNLMFLFCFDFVMFFATQFGFSIVNYINFCRVWQNTKKLNI